MLKSIKIFALLLILALLPSKILFAANSVSYLNDPKYTVGVSDKGAALDAVRRDLPKAKLAYYDGVDGFMAVKTSKIDAYINDRITMILALKEGFTGVKFLPDSIGEPIKIAIGISRKSKIPGLLGKINNFIAELKTDGTLADMKKRWIIDSDYTMPEIKAPDKPKFKLRVGTVGMIPPYSFYVNSKLTGHDIEFVKRFAAWLGADIIFKDYDFAGVIAAAVTGDIDIIAANLQNSPERAEKIDFSDVIMSSDFTAMIRENDHRGELYLQQESHKAQGIYKSVKDLDGQNIGVQTGNPEWDKMIKQLLPNSKIVYYNTFTDLVTALEARKIQAFPGDEPTLRMIAEENNDLAILDDVITETYGISFAFALNQEGANLRDKFNEFMNEIRANGELNRIVKKWTVESNNRLPADYESLPGTKGTITFATEGEYPPFNYYINGKVAGLEIDLAYEFCKSRGYGLNIITMNYEAIPAAVKSRKADFTANFTADDEHGEAMNFSIPYYYCTSKMMIRKSSDLKPAHKTNLTPDSNHEKFSSLKDFDGKRIGVITGSVHPDIIMPVLPSAELFYFDRKADELAALSSYKIDAFLCSEPEAISLLHEDNNLAYMNAYLSKFDLAYCTAKTPKGKALADELSEFIRRLNNDGTLKSLQDKWFLGTDESQKTLEDYSQLPAKNGVIKFAQFVHGIPFTYVRDNIVVGYEIELLVKFCKEKGYALEVLTMDFSGILPAVISGKCDVAGGGVIITPERSEQVYFTDSIYNSGTVLITLKSLLNNNIKPGQKISDFNGKRIGALTSSVFPELIKQKLPDSQVLFYQSRADEVAALLAGKIDAFALTEPEAISVENEDKRIIYIRDYLNNVDFAFGLDKNNNKLLDELNKFISGLDSDGTLERLRDKWFRGNDESQKTLEDYSNLPAANGVIRFIQDGASAPFSYVRDNIVVGYEIELLARFCKEYGYKLEILTIDLGGMIPAVQSGRGDIMGGGVVITSERAEKINFTVPDFKSGGVFLVLKSKTQILPSVKDFDGKKISVPTGNIADTYVRKNLPKSEILYLDNDANKIEALLSGKIDAFAVDEPQAMILTSANPELVYIPDYLMNYENAFFAAKNSKGEALIAELNEFIKREESNGTLENLRKIWFNSDESRKIITDYENLPDIKGVIKFAQQGDAPPYAYFRNNKIVGYDVEIIARFCKERGYKLELETLNFNAIIPAVQSGKCDLGGVGFSITPERAEKVIFSEPIYRGGGVLVIKKNNNALTISDFDGKKITVSSVSVHDQAARENLPHSEILYLDNYANQMSALLDGKVDAMIRDEPEAIVLKELNPQLDYIHEYLMSYDNAFIAAKNEHGDKLLAQLNEFIKQADNNGTLKNLRDIWFHSDESKKVMTDYENLPDINGVINFATDPETPPFTYIRDNKAVGYDIEIIARFCKEYGYKLIIENIDFGGLLASVASGKSDLAGGAITITNERAQQVNFSEPIYRGGNVLIYLKQDNLNQEIKRAEQAAQSWLTEFMKDLESSFERTFLRENRWQLFAEGTLITLTITVLAIIFGTLLGFAIYMMCRRGNLLANLFARFSVWLIHGMPIIVLLMILYYVVFSNVAISGLWVAVIAFTLIFGLNVYTMILSGVGAVDKGQTEAALALGFSDSRTFFTVILPQAALHFMPGFKAAVVELIKSTAIVGYIAVQDLTKMGDIIRSRTYEAFFPLIAVAVIYFILAGILNLFSGMIHNRLKPERRKPSDILRGIDTRKE
ncbi:MAG: transporter substrate-binding domain-containing protein [Synergistaceae bacterium]|nr:transporter substrate-binding domain-containing protein [Synergistaceae bacterium]